MVQTTLSPAPATFHHFELCSADDIQRVISASHSKTCELHPCVTDAARPRQFLSEAGFWLYTALYNLFCFLSKPVQALSVKWTTKFQSLQEMPRDFSHFVKWLSELVISRKAWNV